VHELEQTVHNDSNMQGATIKIGDSFWFILTTFGIFFPPEGTWGLLV